MAKTPCAAFRQLSHIYVSRFGISALLDTAPMPTHCVNERSSSAHFFIRLPMIEAKACIGGLQ
jgi:hypothetical protein